MSLQTPESGLGVCLAPEGWTNRLYGKLSQGQECVFCFVLLNRYWGIIMYGLGASS